MKSLKILLILAIVTMVKLSSAQTTDAPAPAAKAHQATPSGQGKDASQDFETRMAKFQESYQKMQAQAPKAKDPQMKADMQAMLSKMNTINTEYNNSKAAGVSSEQQKQMQQQIQNEMKDVRKMHDDIKAKYGDQMGSKKKAAPQQPTDESPAPKGEDIK